MSSYAPPFIGIAGLTIPSYNAILNYLIGQFQTIYGVTVYLGNDSADFQFISILALAISDQVNALQLDYGNRAPNFAVGAALDSLVKLNGLARKQASFSTCPVTLTGTAGAVITSGIVTDVNGIQWNLPPSVVIGGGGTSTVLAVCSVPGTVNALVGQITSIFTPTAGWTSVTNSTAATIGQPVETDSQLRARQAISTELPSITMLAGTTAAIAAVPGVTRYFVEENPTGSTDANGCPPHSITAVVEGGTDLAVATAIFENRGIGCLTNGTTSVTVTDPNTGLSMPIGFDRPTYVPIYVIVNAHLLPGGTSGTIAAIAAAITAYLNSLQIGELVSYGALVAEAMSVNANLSQPIVSVHSLFFATTPTPTTTADIPMLFNQVAQGIAANVTVNAI